VIETAGATLPRLSERPFRTLPGGILRKFPRRLGQFPLSFPAESRWVPRSFGEVATSLPSLERVGGDRPLTGLSPLGIKRTRRRCSPRGKARFIAHRGGWVRGARSCESATSLPIFKECGRGQTAYKSVPARIEAQSKGASAAARQGREWAGVFGLPIGKKDSRPVFYG